MTIEELALEIMQIRDESMETLLEMHDQKISKNSYGYGYETGSAETCQRLLDLMRSCSENR